MYNLPMNKGYIIECSQFCESIDSLNAKIDQYATQKRRAEFLMVKDENTQIAIT